MTDHTPFPPAGHVPPPSPGRRLGATSDEIRAAERLINRRIDRLLDRGGVVHGDSICDAYVELLQSLVEARREQQGEGRR